MIQDAKMPQLPGCSGLDIGALSASFRSTTTSYKFLWFLSILDVMEESNAALPIDQIIINMQNTAKPLIEKYRLYFGKDDRMRIVLSGEADAHGELPNSIRRRIRRFVPYRFLVPFFSDELGGLTPEERNHRIRALTESRFSGDNPAPYKLIGNTRNIEVEIHPAWRAYFRENIALLRAWVNWHWVLFLETRNPNRPNIARQILPENNREPMTQQRRFWTQVMKHAQPMECPYSNEPLSAEQFALDHYVPFNFIGHNQLWNLHPVDSRANSAKSDSLPPARYLESFVKRQHNALTLCWKNIITPRDARYAFAEYSQGLRMDVENKVDIKKMKVAYDSLMPPLIIIARSYGFSDWKRKGR